MAFSSVPAECSYSMLIPFPSLQKSVLSNILPPWDAFGGYAQFRAFLLRFAPAGVLW